MVMSYGFNRDMGYDTLIDKEYRHLVTLTIISQGHFISLFSGGRDHSIKYSAWLYLMGLIETEYVAMARS